MPNCRRRRRRARVLLAAVATATAAASIHRACFTVAGCRPFPVARLLSGSASAHPHRRLCSSAHPVGRLGHPWRGPAGTKGPSFKEGVAAAAAATVGAATGLCAAKSSDLQRWLPGRLDSGSAQPAEKTLQDVFAGLKGELNLLTKRTADVELIIETGLDAAVNMEEKDLYVQRLQELLVWLRRRRSKEAEALRPQSWGPLAATRLRNTKTKQQVLVLGTTHSVEGLCKSENPVPRAVRQAISRMKPDMVAVELDLKRGKAEVDKLPAELFGASPCYLPEKLSEAVDIPESQVHFDMELCIKIKDVLGNAPPAASNRVLQAARMLWAESRDIALGANFAEFSRLRAANDFGRDMSAALTGAHKRRCPVLFCDFEESATMNAVLPAMTEAMAKVRESRLSFLQDDPRAEQLIEAEVNLIANCVLENRGSDLSPLEYITSLVQPAMGLAETTARPYWFGDRDEAMAENVVAALSGRVRGLQGDRVDIASPQRVVLVVGCHHVEGITQTLVSEYGMKAVPVPDLKAKSEAAAGERGARGAASPRSAGGRGKTRAFG